MKFLHQAALSAFLTLSAVIGSIGGNEKIKTSLNALRSDAEMSELTRARIQHLKDEGGPDAIRDLGIMYLTVSDVSYHKDILDAFVSMRDRRVLPFLFDELERSEAPPYFYDIRYKYDLSYGNVSETLLRIGGPVIEDYFIERGYYHLAAELYMSDPNLRTHRQRVAGVLRNKLPDYESCEAGMYYASALRIIDGRQGPVRVNPNQYYVSCNRWIREILNSDRPPEHSTLAPYRR